MGIAVLRNNEPARYWYLLLLLGLMLIAGGLIILLRPLRSYGALSILFGLAFLLPGVIEMGYSIYNRKYLENWGWSLVGGIIGMLIGLMLISQPDISLLILPIFVGFGIMFRSALVIGWAIDLKRAHVPDWWNFLAMGIVGVLFSFFFLSNPWLTGMALVAFISLTLIFVGAFQVYISFKLKKLNKAGMRE